ncbi:MAG: hypothetical protein K6G58_00770 [Lachnospiraceae bacterium]|nr:hypothetical protein [Lachnospiraceae bacterium]
MSELFRKKSLEKVTTPEELNDYIKVTSAPVWIVLTATVLLLAGLILWAVFGKVDVEKADGSTQTVSPITFVTN